MTVANEFRLKESWINDRGRRKKYPVAYKLWRNRIIVFCDFSDQRKVQHIKNIQQADYDAFIRHISATRAARTVADYKYALKHFFGRTHLSIHVQTSPKKQAGKRTEKIRSKLLKNFDKKLTDEILRVIGADL